MITKESQQAIISLHERGVPTRQISQILKISRNTVKRVLQGKWQDTVQRPSSYGDLSDVVREAFASAEGNAVRVQEILESKCGRKVPYSTLTRIVRDLELRQDRKQRAGAYVFGPGEEMQHDTSPHQVLMGGKKVKAQCADLVLAYSRRLFIQYYPAYTRFEARVFLDSAFRFMDGACTRCIIDNTSGWPMAAAPMPRLPPRWSGSARFLASPSFLTPSVIPIGREKSREILLMPYIPPVYQTLYRTVDVAGYVQVDTNRYSAPERLVGKDVEIHKLWERVEVFFKNQKVADHPRLLDKRETRVTAPGHHPPFNRQRAHEGASVEEKALLGQHEWLDRFVGELKKRSGGRAVRSLRRLLDLKRTYPPEAFEKALVQALRYGLYDLSRLEQLILSQVAGDFFTIEEEEEV